MKEKMKWNLSLITDFFHSQTSSDVVLVGHILEELNLTALSNFIWGMVKKKRPIAQEQRKLWKSL